MPVACGKNIVLIFVNFLSVIENQILVRNWQVCPCGIQAQAQQSLSLKIEVLLIVMLYLTHYWLLQPRKFFITLISSNCLTNLPIEYFCIRKNMFKIQNE